MSKKYKYMKFFIDNALNSANMSYCKRRKVGAVIVKDNRTIVNGWNGTVSGEDNECEENFHKKSDIETAKIKKIKNKSDKKVAKEFCKEYGLIFVKYETNKNKILVKYKRPSIRTKASVVHAEANAIAFAAKEGIATKDCTLYVTLSPCMNCSNLIIQSGIKKVIFFEEYRDNSGIEHLKRNGIKVKKFKEKNIEK